jgi:tRNA pseudouridine55 synthase
VLPLFLGRATKLVEYHLGDTKGYRATICFGASSTTDDLEGDLTPAPGPGPTRKALEGALGAFVGPISQRPPAYSAIKVAGRRAYALARAGEAVALAERQVTIERLDLLTWDDADPDRPIATLDVRCSAGTYIRALARDVGAAVGGAAYLGALARTASGPFTLDQAISVDDIRSAAGDGPEQLAAMLLPVDAGLDALPEVVVTDADVGAIARGQFVRVESPPVEGPIRVRDPRGRLVAIGRFRDGRLAPDKVLVDAPAAAAAHA